MLFFPGAQATPAYELEAPPFYPREILEELDLQRAHGKLSNFLRRESCDFPSADSPALGGHISHTRRWSDLTGHSELSRLLCHQSLRGHKAPLTENSSIIDTGMNLMAGPIPGVRFI